MTPDQARSLPAVVAEIKELKQVWVDTLRPIPLNLRCSYDPLALALVRHADLLLAAAEECERLREAVVFAANCYDEEMRAMAGSDSDMLREVCAKARAALEGKT